MQKAGSDVEPDSPPPAFFLELITLNRGLQIYVGRSLPFAGRTRSNPDSKPRVFLKEEPQARRNTEASRAERQGRGN